MAKGLETDLYELTMAAGYWRAGCFGSATFELFVRRLPAGRSYLIAAGAEQAIEHLEQLSYRQEDRDWLKQLPQLATVPPGFFDEYLARFRFRGDVWAIEEGTPVFAGEPIARVTAPIADAQIVETALLAIIGFQTSVASKAARMVTAAAGRPVVEFGARRAHGLGAAAFAARAAYVAGSQGTSLLSAARQFHIPAVGTMAHSWVQAFGNEMQAFHEFATLFADSAVYLLDTYDTIAAASSLAASGLRPRVVRLDSGDFAALSRQVRAILDEHDLGETKIFVTGDLDEHRIAALVHAGAPVDGFGVGAALATVNDAAALPAVYKLVAVERDGQEVDVIKLSPGKQSTPGAKQVWRIVRDGRMIRDVVAGAGEAAPKDSTPLLVQMMAGGRRVRPAESLESIRERFRQGIAALPDEVKRLDTAEAYPVDLSTGLQRRRAASAVRASTEPARESRQS